MRRKWWLGVAALVATGILLTGCGDGDDDALDAASTTTTVSSGPTSSAPRVTTTTARGTTTVTGGETLECGSVGFTPNSEDAASSIGASGLSCDEARAFVRIAGQRTSSGGPPSVQVDGYRCVLVRSVEDPLPQAFYECTNNGKKVTFVRT